MPTDHELSHLSALDALLDLNLPATDFPEQWAEEFDCLGGARCLAEFIAKLARDSDGPYWETALKYPLSTFHALSRVAARGDLSTAICERMLMKFCRRMSTRPVGVHRQPGILALITLSDPAWRRLLICLPDTPAKFLSFLKANESLSAELIGEYETGFVIP